MDKFDEFAENEVLFEYWWNFLCYERKIFGDAYFMELWAKAKDIAIGVLGSKKARLKFRREIDQLRNYFTHPLIFDLAFDATFCCATTMIIISSKKDEVDYILEEFDKVYHLQENEIAIYAADLINSIEAGEIKKDYDYSKVDGGIKDETETDETETDETITITKTITKTDTQTKTKTDETITKTITETEEESVDVILPKYNALNDVDFISAMQKAIEIGWIEEIEDSRYKWIGPTLIGTKKIKGYSNAALAYFIAKALKIKMELNQKKSLTETSKDSIKNNFPPINDIKEVFGEEIKRQQLEDALERKNVQVWRKPIDEFFEDIYNFIGN